MHSTDDVAIAFNPIPADAHTALLFGGTFDPPHIGHLTLPPLVRDAIGADLVVYIPAHRSPHKQDGPRATGAQRVTMLRAGLAGQPRCAIATLEIEADDGPSYTIDTVERLKRERPNTALRLMIGADQARAFHRWRDAQRLLEHAPPAVALRAGDAADNADTLMDAMRAHWDDRTLACWRRWCVALPRTIDASATSVRELLRAGVPLEDPRLARVLSEPVRAEIDAHGLYR